MNTDIKKQTALEWLVAELNNKAKNRTLNNIQSLLDIAVKMEAEQIINARQDGLDAVFKGYSISNEEYYNETYGGDK
jgi:hypothetical protein